MDVSFQNPLSLSTVSHQLLFFLLPYRRHSLSRELRFRFLAFGFCIIQGSETESGAEFNFRNKLYVAAFDWFSVLPTYGYTLRLPLMRSD
jgi:hypothetical protein